MVWQSVHAYMCVRACVVRVGARVRACVYACLCKLACDFVCDCLNSDCLNSCHVFPICMRMVQHIHMRAASGIVLLSTSHLDH